jgi:hypothetical protein
VKNKVAQDIMPKISEGQFALGGLGRFSCLDFMVLPFLHSTPAHALTAERPTCRLYFWLEVFTAAVALATTVLAGATIGLGRITYWGYQNQLRDVRILQRSHLGTKPGGLHEMMDRIIIAYVMFVNSGNMPARNFRNKIRICLSPDGEKKRL